MTTTSTPVLRGSGGAVLRHEDDALTLRRGGEEIRIPLQAVRDVVPDGRAVAVELRAPAGATPTVHRVEGVGEAAVGLFAAAMAEVLAALPEPDPALDGATLVTTRSLRTPRPPVPPGEWAKGCAHALVGLGPALGASITMSVLVVMHGEPGLLVLSVLLGIIAIVLNIVSYYLADRAIQMWRLPRRGITVMAVRTRPYGKSGTYTYTDQSGATHSYYRQAYANEIEISYHPDRPGVSVGVYPAFVRVLVALLSLVLWSATVGLVALMILMGVST